MCGNKPAGSFGSEIPLYDTLVNFLPKTKRIRYLIVSQELTKKINPYNPTAFIQALARNIGIRRATSEFIVSTNNDVIVDRPEHIDIDTMYTVARYNVPEQVVYSLVNSPNYLESLREMKGQFEKRPCINSATETQYITHDPGDVWSLVVGCGDYQLAHRDIWYKIRGFEESMVHRGYDDSNIMKKASKFYKIDRLDLDIFHLDHPVNPSANYTLNDKIKYVNNFDETTNPDTWGFSDIEIPELRI